MKSKLILSGLSLLLLLLVGPWGFSYLASKAYDSGSWQISKFLWDAADALDMGHMDRLSYNKGNALYRLDRLAGAESNYSRAAKSDDINIKCMALYNWSQSLDKRGESAEDEDDYTQAIALYNEALSHVVRIVCQNEQQYEQNFKSAAQQLQDKIDRLNKQKDDKQQQQQNQTTQDQKKAEDKLDDVQNEITVQRGQTTNERDQDYYSSERDYGNVIW